MNYGYYKVVLIEQNGIKQAVYRVDGHDYPLSNTLLNPVYPLYFSCEDIIESITDYLLEN